MLEKLKKWFGEEQGAWMHGELGKLQMRVAELEKGPEAALAAMEERIKKLENSVHGTSP